MPQTDDFTQSVAQWKAQKLSELRFRQEQIEHSAILASAMVLKNWNLETVVTEAEYNEAIELSKGHSA